MTTGPRRTASGWRKRKSAYGSSSSKGPRRPIDEIRGLIRSMVEKEIPNINA